MAMPFPNETESSVILKMNPKKPNLISLWAFLISILVYVWVFYVFNLSASSDLLCTTKFWFIISNTLILIIAADFSSSKNHQAHTTFNFATMPSPAPFLIHEKAMPIYRREKQEEEEVDDHQEPPEKIINVVHAHVLENKISKIHNEDDGNADSNKSKLGTKEKMVEVEAEKEGEMVLRRTLSEGQREEPMVLEENEFTKMSNEELNKRVEEFIRRFNRQIRLQARQG